MIGHRGGIRVEVEEPAATLHGRGQVSEVVEAKPGTHVASSGTSSTVPHPWGSVSVRAKCVLDPASTTGDGPLGQERQGTGPVVGEPVGQAQAQRVRRG